MNAEHGFTNSHNAIATRQDHFRTSRTDVFDGDEVAEAMADLGWLDDATAENSADAREHTIPWCLEHMSE